MFARNLRLGLALLAACISAVQAEVVFTWDASPEPNIRGYNLYLSEQGSPITKVPLGQQTSTTLEGFEVGKTYAIWVTAVSSSGQESRPTDPVIYSPGPELPVILPGFAPPKITLQPVGQVVVEGDQLQLRVEASSKSPLEYQWRRDGVILPGATSDTFLLQSTSLVDSGSYSVLVRNGAGASISSAAQVVVQLKVPPADPPAGGPLPDPDEPRAEPEETPAGLRIISSEFLLVQENTPSLPERIELTTDSGDIDEVVLAAESLDQTLVPNENIFFAGSGSVRYIMMVPAENRHGKSRVLLRATLGEQETTREIEITVSRHNNAPLLSSFPVQLDLISGQNRSVPFQIADPDGDDIEASVEVNPPEFSRFIKLQGSGTDWWVQVVSEPEETWSVDLTVTIRDTGGLSVSGSCAVRLIQPTLSVERQGNDLVVSWPSVAGLHLEISQDFFQGWRSIEDLPMLISQRQGECRLAWTSEFPGLFFRLSVR